MEQPPRPHPAALDEAATFHAPEFRVIGARPARLATALAARRPSSGIWVSRPAATPWTRPAREGYPAQVGLTVFQFF